MPATKRTGRTRPAKTKVASPVETTETSASSAPMGDDVGDGGFPNNPDAPRTVTVERSRDSR